MLDRNDVLIDESFRSMMRYWNNSDKRIKSTGWTRQKK